MMTLLWLEQLQKVIYHGLSLGRLCVNFDHVGGVAILGHVALL